MDKTSVAELRTKAAELRRLAATARLDADRDELIQLAGRYVEIADQMTDVTNDNRL